MKIKKSNVIRKETINNNSLHKYNILNKNLTFI